MSRLPWGKWYWQNWLSDAGLRRCSLQARGMWMDMLCVAAQHDPIGYVAVNGEALTPDDVARLCGTSPAEASTLISELERNGVFSRNGKGMIYSRRMVRDAKAHAESMKYGRRGGNPSLVNPPDNPTLNPTLASEVLSSQEVEEAFEGYWRVYPRRLGANPKNPAFKKFSALVLAGISPATITAGAKNYAAADAGKIGTPYIAQAVTWLNQRRWEDYAANGRDTSIADPELQARAWTALLDRERRTGQWPSKQIHKSEIPSAFIANWQASLTNIAQEAPE